MKRFSLSRGISGRAAGMKRKCTSAQCCDTRGNALYGALFGIVVATLHHIQHALTGQIPENITVHVLSEFIVAACGIAAVFAVGSAICNRLKGSA
jgi:hypothetical protein